MTRINNRHELAQRLIKLQPALAGTGIASIQDVAFTIDTPDTYNIANDEHISSGIARVLAHINNMPGVPPSLVVTLFKNLTLDSTAPGYLAQLQGYDWLISQGSAFTPEVCHTATIRGRPIDLDGRIDVLSRSLFFDIKSFSFEPDLRAIFCRRLKSQFPGFSFTVDGPGNHGPDIINAEAFIPLKAYIAAFITTDRIEIPALRWVVKKHKTQPSVRIATHEYNIDDFAYENRWVPLRFASQFATDAPYLLIFVLPDGLGPSALKIDVFGSLRKLASDIADHLFVAASQDVAPASAYDDSIPSGIAVRDVISRLSGLVFIGPQAKLALLHLNAGAMQALSKAEAAEVAGGWEIAVHGAVKGET